MFSFIDFSCSKNRHFATRETQYLCDLTHLSMTCVLRSLGATYFTLFLSHRLPPVRCLYKELDTKLSKKIETTKKIFTTNGLTQLVAIIAISY